MEGGAAAAPAVAADSADPAAAEAENSAAGRRIKAYKIAVEYRYMKAHAPGGVYVLPSFDDIRIWHGVIFVRRSLYANGIFRFRMELPEEYNDENTWPRVYFTSPVFNPLVDGETGEVALQYFLPQWDPTQHFVITALTSLKKIFYFKLDAPSERLPKWYDDASVCANAEAARLAREDRPAFHVAIHECVVASQTAVHANQAESPINFPASAPDSESAIAGLALALFNRKTGNRTTRHAKSILKAIRSPPSPPTEEQLAEVQEAERAADASPSGHDLGLDPSQKLWEPVLPAFFWDTDSMERDGRPSPPGIGADATDQVDSPGPRTPGEAT